MFHLHIEMHGQIPESFMLHMMNLHNSTLKSTLSQCSQHIHRVSCAEHVNMTTTVQLCGYGSYNIGTSYIVYELWPLLPCGYLGLHKTYADIQRNWISFKHGYNAFGCSIILY